MAQEKQVKAAVDRILAAGVDPSTTLRSIRRKVEADLGLEEGACDAFKDAIRSRVAKQDEKKNDGSEDDRFQKLKALAVAMAAGPSVFRGLADVDDKARVLRDRLVERGANIKNDVPTAREIAAAKAKRARAVDLDGIDSTNILVSDRRHKAGKLRKKVTDENTDEEAEFI